MTITVSYNSIYESMETEFNNYSTLLESIDIIQEAGIKDIDFKAAGKAIIEKIKLVWEKVKTWIEAIKVKLIDHFNKVVAKKAEKILAKAKSLVNKNELKEIKSFKYAVPNFYNSGLTKRGSKRLDKHFPKDYLSTFESIEKEANNIQVIEQLKKYIMNTKFILDSSAVSKSLDKIKDVIWNNTTDYQTSDDEEFDIEEIEKVNDSIIKSQEELKKFVDKEFIHGDYSNKFNIPINFHYLKLNESDPKFVINKFISGINNSINILTGSNGLASVYTGILKRKTAFEKAFGKFLSVFENAKTKGAPYQLYGKYIKHDIEVIKFEAGVFCGLFTAYTKQVIANTAELVKLIYVRDSKADDQLQKDAEDLKKDADNRTKDLTQEMKDSNK